MKDMQMKEKNVLILGAGPAGMAAAFELYKAGKFFTVIEKNESVGGLARTLKYGEFRTDIGPHRFFSQNKYLYSLIEDLLKEKWIKVDRLTRFYIDGKFFHYPIILKEAILNVDPYKAFRIMFDYVLERVKKVLIKKNCISFEDQVVSDFGRTLAELNMLNYTEKIWGLPCSAISSDWLRQRIRGLSVMTVIRNALIKMKNSPKTLVDQFYYPDCGIGLICEKMKEEILSKDTNSIQLNSYPIEVIHNDNKVIEIVCNINGVTRVEKPDFIISSIPIIELVKLLKPKAPLDILRSADNLKFRSHVSLFITLNKSSVFPDQWIYFPDKQIPFGRIMEPKNFSKKMSPADKTSLLIEFFCWEGDEIWNTSKEQLFELSIEWLEKIRFIKREEVIDIFVHREKYAYPVYDLDYKENLGKVKNYLKRFSNLQLIGRSGSFRYNNLDHALEMGILSARSIIEGKQYNLEEIGAEKEYFERGYVK